MCYHWGWGGMWLFPAVLLTTVLIAALFVFRRGCCGPAWWCSETHDEQEKRVETPPEILKRRYANGEITKEQFEQMKRDIQN